MNDTWPIRQQVITAMQALIKQAHRQMDAAQTGDNLPRHDWVMAQAHAAAARRAYQQQVET